MFFNKKNPNIKNRLPVSNNRSDPGILAGLDLGTSKISIAVAERDTDGAQIIGIGQALSTGMRKGLITNLDQTVQSIRAAVMDAQTVSGVEIDRVTVAFSGDNITSVRSSGMVSLGGRSREVRVEDIIRAIDAAQANVNVPANRTIIHTIPISYSLDGESSIDDPIGMSAMRLDIEIQSIIVPTAVYQNVINCVNRAGLEIDSLVVKPLVSALGVLTPDEASRGAAVADIGGGTIGISVFKDGRPKHLGLIPLGGDEITNDLGGSGLKIPLSAAELLKRSVVLSPDDDIALSTPLQLIKEMENILSFKSLPDDEDAIEFSFSGQRCSVSKKELTFSIHDRIDYFLENIKREIVKGHVTDLPGGLILSGGVSKTPEIGYYISEKLQLSTRLGYPIDCEKMPPSRNSQEYAAVSGIIKYIMDNERNPYRYLGVPKDIPQSHTTKVKPEDTVPNIPITIDDIDDNKKDSLFGFFKKILNDIF